MTTLAQIEEAHRRAPKSRFALHGLLRVDETLAQPEDLELIARFRAVTTPEQYDKALSDKKVNDLFCRGVLFFGRDG